MITFCRLPQPPARCKAATQPNMGKPRPLAALYKSMHHCPSLSTPCSSIWTDQDPSCPAIHIAEMLWGLYWPLVLTGTRIFGRRLLLYMMRLSPARFIILSMAQRKHKLLISQLALVYLLRCICSGSGAEGPKSPGPIVCLKGTCPGENGLHHVESKTNCDMQFSP